MVFGGGCALAQSASKACTRPPTQRFQIPSEVIPVAPKRRRSYSATRSGEHTMIFKLKHANAAAYIHLVWTIVARDTQRDCCACTHFQHRRCSAAGECRVSPEGIRQLHGPGDEGLECTWHWHRHRDGRQTRLRQRIRLPRLREEGTLHDH